MLVSVGRDNSGALWLVNLEPLGSIALTGDGDHALAFARHAAAELALNPWSVLVQTDTFGIGEELGDLDTLRLRTHDADDDAVRSVMDEIQAASRRQGEEPDPWQVVIATNVDLAALIDDARAKAAGRFGVAVVTVAAAPPEDAAVFEFTPAGRLTTPTIGIDVAAAGLTAEEATLCAAIVDVTRVTPTTGIPNFAQAADGWRSVADQAGALRPEFTRPRLVGATGSTSLLPERTDAYVGLPQDGGDPDLGAGQRRDRFPNSSATPPPPSPASSTSPSRPSRLTSPTCFRSWPGRRTTESTSVREYLRNKCGIGPSGSIPEPPLSCVSAVQRRFFGRADRI